PAPTDKDDASSLGALYDAVRTGDGGAFHARFTQLSAPPLLPILLATIDHRQPAIAAFVISQAKKKMGAEEWAEAASQAMEHAINSGQKEILKHLLDQGAPADARFAWVAAAKHDSVDMLEQLAEKAPAQNLNIESGRAKEAFNAAVAAGKFSSAEWLAGHARSHMDAKDMQKAASAAMTAQDETAAMWLIGKAEEKLKPGDDALRRIYNTLMNDAINAEFLPGIDYLYGKAQNSYATALVATAHADRIKSFTHILSMAATAGVAIEKTDLQTTLMIAADHGSVQVTRALVELGVDISVHNQGALRKAVDNYARDGFAPVRFMLEHGADPVYALSRAAEKFPNDSDLQKQISQLADNLAAEAATNFSFIDFTPENLRRAHPQLGMTPLHYAAEKRLFATVMEKAGAQLTTDDYLSVNKHGDTLVSVLERQSQLADILKPQLWAGQRDKALSVLQQTSDKFRKDFDSETFLREVSQLTLRQTANPRRYKLGL
ncbi:MAG: hypothetical protein IT560_14535, partial [Alphaproteobacteria bacterium]|nr:hypothetical protein [Alphaproteobacteria bacterium]